MTGNALSDIIKTETAIKEECKLNTLPVEMFDNYNQNRRTCIETYQNLAYKFSDAAIDTSLPRKDRRYYVRKSFRAVKMMRSISYADITVALGIVAIGIEIIRIYPTIANTVKDLCA